MTFINEFNKQKDYIELDEQNPEEPLMVEQVITEILKKLNYKARKI